MCGARRSNNSGVNFRARSSTHGCVARNSFSPTMAPASYECVPRSPKTCWKRATGSASRRPSPRSRARHALCGSRSSLVRARATEMKRRILVAARRAAASRLPTMAAMTGPRSSPPQMSHFRQLRAVRAHRRRARRFRPPPMPAEANAYAPRSTVAAPATPVAVVALVRAPNPAVARKMTTGPTEPPRLTRASRLTAAPPRRPHQSHSGPLPIRLGSLTPPLWGDRVCSFQRRV